MKAMDRRKQPDATLLNSGALHRNHAASALRTVYGFLIHPEPGERLNMDYRDENPTFLRALSRQEPWSSRKESKYAFNSMRRAKQIPWNTALMLLLAVSTVALVLTAPRVAVHANANRTVLNRAPFSLAVYSFGWEP